MSKEVYRYYSVNHPHLSTLRIHQRSARDVAQKVVVRSMIVLVFFITEAVVMWSFAEAQINHNPQKSPLVTGARSPSAQVKPKQPAPPKPESAPMYLVVPKLLINVPVEPVGIASGGEMANPSSLQKVAWYKEGPKPGAEGSVVLAGHTGNPTESGIFKNLTELKEGDNLEVRQEGGATYTYKVYKLARSSVANVDTQELFNKSGGKFLNLVTCVGEWNKTTNTYQDRLIVYAELAQ